LELVFLVLPKLLAINFGVFLFNSAKLIKNTIYNLILTNSKRLNDYFAEQEPEVSNIDIDSSFLTALNNSVESENISTRYAEIMDNQRISRFNNALINYDYKTGNYVGYWENKYPFLINIFIEIARGNKKPAWFFSEKYQDLFESNYKKFYISYTGKANLKMSSSEK
jgi:hypothetical protein